MNKKIIIGLSIFVGLILLTGIIIFSTIAKKNADVKNLELNAEANQGTESDGSASSSSSSDSSDSNSDSSSSGDSSGGTSSDSSSSGSGSGSGSIVTPPLANLAIVNLGTANSFVILSKSGISTTGTTAVTGNIGVSPIDSTAITGFGLIMDVSNEYATSTLVTGKIYAADYTTPTPTKMTTAISDMELAYADASGRTSPTATELGAGNIDGMTLTPGLYKWGTDLIIPAGVTLDCQGNSNAVFIFQIAGNLVVGNGAIVTLSGGCQAKNLFWQTAGQATLGTTSQFKGNILSATLIEINTGASLNGRALAQTAVTLDANAITIAN